MDKFCRWDEKFSQSGLDADFEDRAGQVEGNWRVEKLRVNPGVKS